MNPKDSLELRRYYAVGTALYPALSPEARLISRAVTWLLEQCNADGTWGGKDSLDQLVTTNHAVMALLAVGFSPDSKIISPAIDYMVNVDKEKVISFFWRAGPLLNLPQYVDIVREDMEYLWRFKRRIGAHKDYPIPFFLFKLIRFINPKPSLSFSEVDVLNWILEEWDSKDCWYARTSISSMALALIYDLEFPDKHRIIETTTQFLEANFREIEEDRGYFSGNLVARVVSTPTP